MRLKNYSLSAYYADVFRYNFKEIDNIQSDELFDNFVKMLACISRIDYEIVLIELKRYLMLSREYFPDNIRVRFIYAFLLPYFILGGIPRIFFNKCRKDADIIIDDCSINSADNLYGRELMNVLNRDHKCLMSNFRELKKINMVDLLNYCLSFAKSFLFARHIRKRHGIDLRRYVFSFFSDFLSGLCIKRCYQPKLVISWNDNGLAIIKAKACGADILLIQNGLRDHSGDASFKYADYYISIGTRYPIETRVETGCIFKKIYSLGSLRMYNFLKNAKNKKIDILYDLLWVGGWDLCGPENIFLKSKYYSMEAHYKALRLINDFAIRTNLRVAYHCRYECEIEDLKKLGLFCDKITYFKNSQKNVYQSVLESDIILSCVSTVSLEALGLGKKVGFINLSENNIINLTYRNLDVEYNLNSGITFEEFIRKIREKEFNFNDYAIQNPNYVEVLSKIVTEALKAKRA